MIVQFSTHIVTAYGCFNPGEKADIPSVNAEDYIRLGYCTPVEKIERAINPPQTEKRIQPNGRK